ncbi:putative inactive ATP-dependent zinc metalloprotease FTSHI 3 [Sesbania bispinosa]|nr:putative inactive ATP-dependent zinc metalloprotease FTSHI 3 [Sesbania bispinosa]
MVEKEVLFYQQSTNRGPLLRIVFFFSIVISYNCMLSHPSLLVMRISPCDHPCSRNRIISVFVPDSASLPLIPSHCHNTTQIAPPLAVKSGVILYPQP